MSEEQESCDEVFIPGGFVLVFVWVTIYTPRV